MVATWNDAPGVGWYRVVLAAAQYFTYRDEQRTFENVAVWVERPVTMLGDGDPERIPALMVSDGFLPILGVQPCLGRPFTRGDDLPGPPPQVMITYGFWQARFGGDPDVVGRSIGVNGEPTEVIGVLPRGFRCR